MTTESPSFEWAAWTFEPAEWRLSRAGAGPVSLPNKTLELLALLLDRAPGLVSKDEILSTVWRDSVVEEGNIAFHIAILRKTIDVKGSGSCVETVRGKGYRFVCPVTRHIVGREEPGVVSQPAASPVALGPTVVPAPARPIEAAPSVAVPVPVELVAQVARRPRAALVLWPAAALLAAVSITAWMSLANLDARVRQVVVMPARASDGSTLAGVAESISARLARETTLAASAGEWASASESDVDAGRRLQAETVLVATVDRSANPWRVAASMTRLRDGDRLWAWEFDMPSSIPAIESAIGGRIAAGVALHLGTDVRPDNAVNAEALALTLRGREAWRARTPPSVQQAISFYERAIAIDPAFARAYAGLADCYNLTMSGLPVEVRALNAKSNAERALALDPGLADAHTSLAFALYKFEWRWRESEAEFKRAIQADPSYALAHHWYGELLAYLGRFDEAIAEMRLALALEPSSLAVRMDLAGPLMHSGRLAEARAVVESAAAINPTFHAVPGRMAEILAAEGRERESLEEAWRTMILRGATLESVEELRAAYRTGGADAVLRVEIARLEEGGPGRFEVPARATFLASKYARLRDRAKTLQWIATAIDRREDIALHLPTYPEYDWLRDDPEFKRQLGRLGL